VVVALSEAAGGMSPKLRRPLPDDQPVYTVEATEAEAEALARGELPAAIQNAMIGLLIALRETPAQFLERQTVKRQGQQTPEAA
jgi:hypothetical protein